jgi:hypothetical protein
MPTHDDLCHWVYLMTPGRGVIKVCKEHEHYRPNPKKYTKTLLLRNNNLTCFQCMYKDSINSGQYERFEWFVKGIIRD